MANFKDEPKIYLGDYSNYDFKNDEEFYKRFKGRTIEVIKQKNPHQIWFKFTDGTVMHVFNKGIHNNDEHLHIYDNGLVFKDSEEE